MSRPGQVRMGDFWQDARPVRAGWTRQMKVLVAVSAVVLVVATGMMWQSGTRGAEVANVLALSVASVTLLLAEVRRRGHRRAADPTVLARHARDLAREIAGQEARVRQRLLCDTGDARPADAR